MAISGKSGTGQEVYGTAPVGSPLIGVNFPSPSTPVDLWNKHARSTCKQVGVRGYFG